ncbi:tetratricopeptide repeat-containing sensor histidine kinase [Bacteroides stercorirosoris]|uniref:histidine kinase n=1 Tax=Bacteroides stercorirosoris TaxID=871324 RepID=A0A1M6JDC8_9BACE|nr:HAMP domain-containing sensor histidine kinase [Bacteroides stercorirosoris]SHJ44727.1 His Kinase A (phospho-acceptor) domain-containing protein [Bacteroides stercorirosoris]
MRYILTTIFISISSILFAQNMTQATDSLLHLLNATASSEKKIQIYRDLADISIDTPDAKTYLLKMYREAEKINDKKNMLDALNDIVTGAIISYNKDSIIKYTEYIKKIATTEEKERLLPFYHIRIFESQCFSDQKETAIKEELNLLDSINDNVYGKIASAYTMGFSFYIHGQFDKALPHLENALQLTKTIPEKDRYDYQRYITLNLCFTYAQTGKEKESIKIMENLINLVELKYKTDYEKQRPFYKIELYLLQYYSFMIGNLPYLTVEQAQDYWNRIQIIGKTLTNDLDRYNYYLCANNYYSNNRIKKDYPRAIEANDSLIRIAKTLAPVNLPGLYNINSLLYEEIKDYPNALKYLKISHQIQDSLTTDAAHKQLNELQVKYDLNALNNEKTMLEVKNKQTLLISLSILLIIVISICTYLYFSLKKEKRMKMELKVLHGKAQESEKMKQAFINSICHEIRTPLNAIVGFSDLIMNEEIDEEMRREFPAEIQKSTVLLTGLVNSMLEVANLDVSEEKLPCEAADLKDICTQEMELLNKKPGIEYILDIAPESMIIQTNVQYLTQVIGHLLNNANKFTEKGCITLSYEADKQQEHISISVTDTGCGIPKEKYEEVFNRFSKLDTFVPGNGLGLYLCRLIVKRLAGEIKIDPSYAEGTRMVVTLPIH